jgi:hypothetical protein
MEGSKEPKNMNVNILMPRTRTIIERVLLNQARIEVLDSNVGGWTH